MVISNGLAAVLARTAYSQGERVLIIGRRMEDARCIKRSALYNLTDDRTRLTQNGAKNVKGWRIDCATGSSIESIIGRSADLILVNETIPLDFMMYLLPCLNAGNRFSSIFLYSN